MAMIFMRLEQTPFDKPKVVFEPMFESLSPENQKRYLAALLDAGHKRVREIDTAIRIRQQKADEYWAQGDLDVRGRPAEEAA